MSATSTITQRKAAEQPVEEGKYGRYFNPVMEADGIRKIVAEACAMNAGKAAVLLQIASKGVGKGVAAHSTFTVRPVERGRRSIVYIYAMAFGTLAERRLVTDATHRAHAHVKGKDYDADDVEEQLWVAATTYWSLQLGYEETYGKLDDEFADQVYKEFSVMATGLRVPPEKWPKDRAAFAEYWDNKVATLEIPEEARGVAKDVLYPSKNLPWGLWLYSKVTGPSTVITTIELLPERIRNEFGIPSTLYTRSMYALLKKWNQTVYPYLPESVRHFPKNYYMEDFRNRVAKGSRL